MGFRKKKTIIADDSMAFIMYIGILLKRMGLDVIPAENGLEVLKLMKMMEPDLVMLDVAMPLMDGIKTLKYIKEDKATAKIPVVMVSTDSSKETIEKCEKLGCSDYLIKPVNIERLHEVLEDNIFAPMGMKRKYLRASVIEKITLTFNGTSHELYSEKLSEGGMYIRKKDPLPVGSEVEITLPLKDNSVHLRGNVIYTKGVYGDMFRVPPGMGIEFRGLTAEDSALLKGHVKELLTRDILDSQEEPVITIEGNKTEVNNP